MTDSLKVSDLVRFRSDLFFEGAVQLRWYAERPERAQEAAAHFVFHGPKYHGVSQSELEERASAYRLIDTASFMRKIAGSILASQRGESPNPLILAVAGYGSGKSHFAVTLSTLLGNPASEASKSALANLRAADPAIADQVAADMSTLGKPALVVALDGMSNFNLGNALGTAIIRQLKEKGLDLGPIDDLSPRFRHASDFVRLNYRFREREFVELFGNASAESIMALLDEHDEAAYEKVDDLYLRANGSRIPVEGSDSAQDLISAVCGAYCGPDGPFCQLLIVFDEFGRFLEYAAEKPTLAGDSALQQIFQGVQDNNERAKFVGFIQYELKAYLSRLNHRDLLPLQRYITRFDSADKVYLSSNLETIIANLIEKRNDAGIERILAAQTGHLEMVHRMLSHALPGFNRYPVWSDFGRFREVIVAGCWPLHALTTWFLTRQQDIVQSRSALTFIKDAIERSLEVEAVSGHFFAISPAELVLQSMLPEIIAAERMQGGNIAERLQTLMETHAAHLERHDQLVLAGVMVLDKLRVAQPDKNVVDALLGMASGLGREQLQASLVRLGGELGILEWDPALGSYELVTDSATRGQFQSELRRKLSQSSSGLSKELFVGRGRTYADLKDVEPDFAERQDIRTKDWSFAARLAHSDSIAEQIKLAFAEWAVADKPDEPKGRVIYLLHLRDDDSAALQTRCQTLLQEELDQRGVARAPVWIIHLKDMDGKIDEYLRRVHILEDQFTPAEKEKFRRFIPDEISRARMVLREGIEAAIKQRDYQVAGISQPPASRMVAAATEIFEKIYPSTLPFPFDGFTSNGRGAQDCATLIRALIAREVGAPWLASQTTQVKNRVTHLLVNSWKVLGSDGKLQIRAGNPAMLKLMDALEELHQQDAQRDLGQTYRMLVAPPYGMNACSAGVVLGIFLAKELPPRALSVKGQSCGLGDWLNQAFPAKGKYIDPKTLSATHIQFLTEDALARWRRFIAEWDSEPNLERKVVMMEEARKMRQSEPVPETLEGNFKFAEEHANQALAEIHKFKALIDEQDKNLIKAEQRRQVDSCLFCAQKLASQKRTMDEQPGRWPDSMVNEVEILLDQCRRLIEQDFGSWLGRQVCNSIHAGEEYRTKMDRAAKALDGLGFKQYGQAVQAQAIKIISQLEKRSKYQATLNAIEDFNRQPMPDSSMPLSRILAKLNMAEEYVKSLDELRSVANSSDLADLAAGLQRQMETLSSFRKARRKELTELDQAEPNTPEQARVALAEAVDLLQVLRGTKFEEDAQHIVDRFHTIEKDLSTWSDISGPSEKVEAALKSAIEARCSEIEARFSDEDADKYVPQWACRKIYEVFAGQHISGLREKSADWLAGKRDMVGDVQTLSLIECDRALQSLENPPAFLSAGDLEQLVSLRHSIQKRKERILEVERLNAVKAWLKPVQDVHEQIDTLSADQCSRLRSILERPPCVLTEVECKLVEKYKSQLAARQSAIDLDFIVERVLNLPLPLQKELMQRLREKLDPA